MLSVYLNRCSSCFNKIYNSEIFQSEKIVRVKQIGINVFTKISESFQKLNTQSNDLNTKTFAMIMCVCLIAILIINTLRNKDTRSLPPPTPIKKK